MDRGAMEPTWTSGGAPGVGILTERSIKTGRRNMIDGGSTKDFYSIP